MKASRGVRRGTRRKFKKGFWGKTRLKDYIKEFKLNDRVIIKISPPDHRTMPYSKFKGSAGVIKGIMGRSYIIETRTGGKHKTVITRPEHIEPIRK